MLLYYETVSSGKKLILKKNPILLDKDKIVAMEEEANLN